MRAWRRRTIAGRGSGRSTSASHALKPDHDRAVPDRADRVRARRRPADRRGVREAGRRSVQRSDLLRRSQRRALHADRRAARADGRDGAVARRHDHRLRLRARRRTGAARPLPAAGRRRRGAQPHRRDHRSADQPAEVDRQPDARGRASRADFKPRSRSSDATAARSRIDGVSGNVSAFARTPDGTIAYVSETASAAPELWIKTANAPARAVTTFNEKWTSRAGGRSRSS